MATLRSDIQSMLGRLSPLRAAPREPDPRVIAHRWEFHKPFALMRARAGVDPAESFAAFKSTHAERFTRLRRADISPESIFRGNLDDPTMPAARFESVLAEAIERRRARMGRVKGRVKPPHRVRKSKGQSK